MLLIGLFDERVYALDMGIRIKTSQMRGFFFENLTEIWRNRLTNEVFITA